MKSFKAGLLALGIAMLLSGSAGDQLTDMIEQSEVIVSNLANAAEEAYARRCSNLEACGGAECSTWECSNTFVMASDDQGEAGAGHDEHALECSSLLGNRTELCGGNSPGQLLDYDASMVRFAPRTDPDTKRLKEAICAFRHLDDAFVDNRHVYDHHIWQYFGSASGVHRSFPGRARSHEGADRRTMLRTCRPYEARLRPWYISAATGPKDVVIVVDKSGSMGEPAGVFNGGSTRMDVLKQALDALFETFTFTDYISVVAFSDQAGTVDGSAELQRADADTIQALQNSVSGLFPNGGTVFSGAIDLAFDLFEEAMSGSNAERSGSSGCSKVLLFLTDGVQAAADKRDHPPLQQIAARQQRLVDHAACTQGDACKASVFTFAMGSGAAASATDLKAISCANAGVYATIEDGADPLYAMAAYFKFLALGGRGRDVVWTTPYQDDGGLGLMTTAAKPAYDEQGLLIGVAGTDFLMSELQQFAGFETVFNALIRQSNSCRNLTLTPCQLQLLRQASSGDAVCDADAANADIASCTDADVVVLPECAAEASSAALCATGDDFRPHQDQVCCDDDSGSAGALVGGLVGGLVGLALIGLIIRRCCCCCSKRKKKKKHQPPPPQQQQQQQPQQQTMMMMPQQAPPPQPVMMASAPPSSMSSGQYTSAQYTSAQPLASSQFVMMAPPQAMPVYQSPPQYQAR